MLGTMTALAEPHRLRIVEALGEGPRSVGELCDELALAQPQASKHLRVLRKAGVVDVRADAQRRIYSLRPEPLRELNAWLARYRAVWDERLTQLDDLVDELNAREEDGHGRGNGK